MKEKIENNSNKAIEELKEFINNNEVQNISIFTAKKILNLIEKQQNKIKDVKTRLEYYLIGNSRFNDETQKEFEKLLKMLEGE
jgi:predicted RND superfamily exporter protein